MSSETTPVRLVSMSAENFKRLKAVRIDFPPGESTVAVTGRNGAGKSCVLDAMQAAFGGERRLPEDPIRHGESRARVVAETDNGLVIERRWTAKSSYLTVTAKDGSTIRSPQAVMDAMVGPGGLAFDPFAFIGMKPKDQVEALQRALGLADAIESFDEARAMAAEARTEIGRRMKQAEADVVANPEVPGPDEEVSVASLLAQRREATEKERAHILAVDEVAAANKALAASNAELDRARRVVEEAEQNVRRMTERVAEAEETLSQTPPVPDIGALDERIARVEADNKAAAKRRARREAKQRAEDLGREYREKTAEIERIEKQRLETIAGVEMPIPGLSIDADRILLNGVPISQAATSEQLRLSVGVAIAANPRLRLILVRNGSLLDETGLKTLQELATKNGAQLVVEITTNGEPGVGIVIEDGEVVA